MESTKNVYKFKGVHEGVWPLIGYQCLFCSHIHKVRFIIYFMGFHKLNVKLYVVVEVHILLTTSMGAWGKHVPHSAHHHLQKKQRVRARSKRTEQKVMTMNFKGQHILI